MNTSSAIGAREFGSTLLNSVSVHTEKQALSTLASMRVLERCLSACSAVGTTFLSFTQ